MAVSTKQYCERIVRRSGSNFRFAFRWLRPDQQRAMRAVYAFCRVIDDVVDEHGDEATQWADLAAWRAAVLQQMGHCADHPLSRELLWAVATFRIPHHYLDELIDGVARDISPMPIKTLSELLTYCYGVAGTVGLICLWIFGVDETPAARAAAIALGNAFQLTNILRDCRADARMGRCYLPQEDLQRFGVTLAELRDGVANDRMAQLLRFEVDRAEGFFRVAWSQFPIDADQRLTVARLMSAKYYALLQVIRRRPLQVLRRRVRLRWWQKLQLLVAGSSFAKASADKRSSFVKSRTEVR